MDPSPSERRGLSRKAKYAIAGVAGCSSLICLVLVSLVVVVTVPDLVGLPLTVVAAMVPALAYVLIVIRLDRYEREPLSLLLGAFFWGSVVAIVLSLILEGIGAFVVTTVLGRQEAFRTLAVIGAPVIEEMSKGLALLILFFLLKNEFDDTLDGIIYGSVVGLGFAMTENMVFFGQQFMEGGVGALAEIFVLRVVLSGLGHALYTGSTGAGLGYAREITNRGLKIAIPIGAFGVGTVQHIVWNGTLQILGSFLPNTGSFLDMMFAVALMSAILSGPALLVLFTIVVFTWRRERRIIAMYLAEEVQSGVVPAEDYAILASSWRRAKATYGSLFSRGIVYWYHLRQLHNAEVKLAFAKWHASQGESSGRSPLHGAEDRLRARIGEIWTRLREL